MMKRFGWKIGLIVGATLLGLAFMWPPSQKLKLGIDLSGGTILVYEVERENLPPGFNMDELIAALKKRADPEGVKEIPIRKIGGNRIEIILPQASNEEVEEVKKMLTDVGSLEFRILANGKHDQGRGQPGTRPGGLAKPPPRLQVGAAGRDLDGNQPDVHERHHHRPRSKSWKKDLYAGTEVVPDRQGLRRAATRTEVGEGAPQHHQHADPRQAARPEVDRVVPGRIQPQPDPGGRPQQSWARTTSIVREEKVAPGRIETWILCNLDRPGQEVTGKYLKQVRPDVDDRLQPAVRFEFDSRGATRFGRLTREHQPEEGGAFRYQLAILLDNLVMSAPAINSEIRDSGHHRRGAAGLQGQGSRALDPGACGPAACRRA